MYLLSLGWWRYVLDDSYAHKDYGPFNTCPKSWWWRHWEDHYLPPALFGNYLSRCLCRARNHPAGVYWYNVGGLEPDMQCRGCGEDLG